MDNWSRISRCLAIVAALLLSSLSMAQQAVGLRVGGGSKFTAEFSYQFAFHRTEESLTDTWWQRLTHKTTLSPISDADRMELDLGFGSTVTSSSESLNYANLSVTYQWHNGVTRRAGWYLGPGAYLSLYQFEDRSDMGFGIGGQVGVDYTFRFPLQVSADFRPMFRLAGGNFGMGWGIAIGCRYMIERRVEEQAEE